jgi:hypothetical protein
LTSELEAARLELPNSGRSFVGCPKRVSSGW